MFRKILVANRGEIAVRVLTTVREMGYGSVAVYSTADAGAPHVALADEAVWLGSALAAESYLSIERVLEAARKSGADAVHPGYGFLSENPDFARACADAGITFVGPPVPAIELMANKRAAKIAMQQAGVPCVPGFEREGATDAQLSEAAAKIGYPVMVKAAAGGGGRGMRLVEADAELAEALRSARSEAESAFGNGELLLEKAVVDARHIEVQVFGDTHGNVIHLGERDCSVQRRHQKVIEEAPSPAVDDELRDKLGAAAVEAASACDYVGAGTVEFLLDPSGQFYFLEMNTRLQVEHPVTEEVTDLDLVEWQLRVAEGGALPLKQSQVSLYGHAIEARLYAEDPARGFLPQTGRLLAWEPSLEARIDSGVEQGSVVSAHYDPMIAKVIARGETRDEARRSLDRALRDTTMLGVVGNTRFLRAVLADSRFAAGRATTSFVENDFRDDASLRDERPPLAAFAVAALLVVAADAARVEAAGELMGWRSGGPLFSVVELETGSHRLELRIDARRADEPGPPGQLFAVDVIEDDAVSATIRLERVAQSALEIVVAVDGVTRAVRYAHDGARLWLHDGDAHVFEDVTYRPARTESEQGSGRLVAPLDGAVIDVRTAEGAAVHRGDVLMLIEAMKMEHRIAADVDGTVSKVLVSKGEQVKTRQLLLEIAEADDAAD